TRASPSAGCPGSAAGAGRRPPPRRCRRPPAHARPDATPGLRGDSGRPRGSTRRSRLPGDLAVRGHHWQGWTVVAARPLCSGPLWRRPMRVHRGTAVLAASILAAGLAAAGPGVALAQPAGTAAARVVAVPDHLPGSDVKQPVAIGFGGAVSTVDLD